MGLDYVTATATGPSGASRTLRLLLDSGAKYSVLPEPVWRSLELSPKRRISFVLADGTSLERDVSECYIELPQGDGHTPVVLGQGDDEALLGVITLHSLGFILDPFNRTIRPARMMQA